MSVNALAFSQENFRFLSCHGQVQIKCKLHCAVRTISFPAHPGEVIAVSKHDPDDVNGLFSTPRAPERRISRRGHRRINGAYVESVRPRSLPKWRAAANHATFGLPPLGKISIPSQRRAATRSWEHRH